MRKQVPCVNAQQSRASSRLLIHVSWDGHSSAGAWGMRLSAANVQRDIFDLVMPNAWCDAASDPQYNTSRVEEAALSKTLHRCRNIQGFRHAAVGMDPLAIPIPDRRMRRGGVEVPPGTIRLRARLKGSCGCRAVPSASWRRGVGKRSRTLLTGEFLVTIVNMHNNSYCLHVLQRCVALSSAQSCFAC